MTSLFLRERLLETLADYQAEEASGGYDVPQSLLAIERVAQLVRSAPLLDSPSAYAQFVLAGGQGLHEVYDDDSEYGGGRGAMGAAIGRLVRTLRELGVEA